MKTANIDNTKGDFDKLTEDIIEIPSRINELAEKIGYNSYEDLNEAILDSLINMNENNLRFSMNELNFEVTLSKTELNELFEFFFLYSHNEAEVTRSDFEDDVLVLNVLFNN